MFDAVYNPEQTLLVKEARLKGCRVVTGVDMFIRQVALQFKVFTEPGAADRGDAIWHQTGHWGGEILRSRWQGTGLRSDGEGESELWTAIAGSAAGDSPWHCCSCIGLLVGGQINRGIYSPGLVSAALGTVVAAAGGLRRPRAGTVCRCGLVGAAARVGVARSGYWIRPLLIELATGFGFAVLYWGEVRPAVALARLAGCGGTGLATLYAQYLESSDARVADDRGDVHRLR